MIYEHWKGLLTCPQQRVYDDVLSALLRRQEHIPVKGIHPQELQPIHKALYYDHPELFYMTHAPGIQQSGGFMGVSITFLCKSIFSAGVIQSYQKKIEEVKAQLRPLISSAKNDFEKEKIICDYLLGTVTYQIDNTLNQNAATALVQQRAQCSGVAKAVKLLLDWLAIPCIVIDGEVNDPVSRQRGPHAWNLVQLDGNWYHLDVTLMMGENSQKTPPFRYSYLNRTDAQMRAIHVWQAGNFPPCVTDFLPPAPTYGAQAPQPAAAQPARAPQQNAPARPMPHTQMPASQAPRPVTQQPKPSAAQAPTRVRKTVSTLQQFRRDMSNIYNAHLRRFEFISAIPVDNAQKLLDDLLGAALDEARKKNLQVEVKITVSGDAVTVELIW